MKRFAFSTNQYQLRTNFLKIHAFDDHGKEIANLKINLYYIVSGPYHHDFSVGKKDARLIFDLKISEVVEVEIQPKKV